MAILDGLKNGYSQYFTYQPSQGLNLNLLMQAGKSQGGSSRRASSGDSTSKNDIKALQGMHQAYQYSRDARIGRESQLKQKLAGAMIEADYKGITDLPEYKEYTKFKAISSSLETGEKINEVQMGNQYDKYVEIQKDLNAKRIGTKTAVINSPGSGLGNTGYNVIGYKMEDGNKVLVDAYVQAFDEDDNPAGIQKNPEAEGLFTANDWMEYQNLNNTINPMGGVQSVESPVVYESGNAWKIIDGEIAASSQQDVKTLLSSMPNPDGDLLNVSKITNWNNLRANVDTVLDKLTDEEISAELIGEFAKAQFSNASLKVITENKDGSISSEWKSVADMNIGEYVTAKTMANAIDQKNFDTITEKIDTGGAAEGGGSGLSYGEAMNNPAVYKNGFKTNGQFITHDGPVGVDTELKDGSVVDWPISSVVMDPEYTYKKNSFFQNNKSSGVHPPVSTIPQFDAGAVLPGGAIVSSDWLTDARLAKYDGKKTLQPAYEKDAGNNLTYSLTDKGTFVNAEEQVMRKVQYGIFDDYSIIVSGEKARTLGIRMVDEKGAADQVKQLTTEMKRSMGRTADAYEWNGKLETENANWAQRKAEVDALINEYEAAKATARNNNAPIPDPPRGYNTAVKDSKYFQKKIDQNKDYISENQEKINAWRAGLSEADKAKFDATVPLGDRIEEIGRRPKKDLYGGLLLEVTYGEDDEIISTTPVSVLRKGSDYILTVRVPADNYEGFDMGTTKGNDRRFQGILATSEGLSNEVLEGNEDRNLVFQTAVKNK